MTGKTSFYAWLARLRVFLIVTLFSALILTVSPVETGRASTIIVVNSTLDQFSTDGLCTLREAIIAANKDQASGSQPGECPAGSGADTITLPAGVYTLTRSDNGKEDSSSTGDLDVLASLTINATGPVTINSNSGFTDRIFHILSGNVAISGVMISGGNASGDGGGIYNKATLTLTNSTLSNNTSSGKGGGIYNAGSATLTNVTLSANTAKTDGGGLINDGSAATMTLNNVTVAFNIADSDANGTGNGGGVFRSSGTLNAKNSIIASNSDNSASAKHPDCSGALTSQGYNLIQNTTGCTIGGSTTGNLTGVSPNLGPLQNNGGNTFTHALLTGSPAIDAGNPATPGSGGNACAATDQRGAARPGGAACDIGAFEKPNPPVLIRAVRGGGSTTVDGRLASTPNTTFTIRFYASATTCPGSTLIGSASVTTDAQGNAFFKATASLTAVGDFVAATATDTGSVTSDPSACVRVGQGNDSWSSAFQLTLTGDPLLATVEDYLDQQGQSRWYKFSVQPNSRVIATLTGLPANYDLTVYKDIQATLDALAPQDLDDLTRLGAEFAPDAFSPDAFSPDAFSPDAFSPDAFSPDAFSPDAFSPDAFSPDAFSPDAFSPDAFSPDAFSPDAFSPDAFSSAQTRSLIGVSAFEGTVGEGIVVNTWSNTGDFYVRVRGRGGAFSLAAPFHLEARLLTGACNNVQPITTASTAVISGTSYKTIILTDLARTPGTSAEKSALQTRLATFATRPEVMGIVVDVGADATVVAANAQADANRSCPYAKNLVAEAIKDIVDRHRALNPSLQYIVIVGNDEAIAFFRHADQAGLASEQNFVPPVKDDTHSQASLKLNYVLSQDDYGAALGISVKEGSFPIPQLAVGRLVETAADATAMLDAYLSDADGVVTPGSALVTGYDFLEDAALAVEGELEAGIGAQADTLIADRNLSPQDPAAWTASDLNALLLGSRHDLIFLAGHFSANSSLAADYTTRLLSTDLAASSVNLANAIVFSAGCHAGYNIVDPHGILGVTREPDWAQAFARKGATLIGGTGYQYGDTDFIEYSERLYLEFSRQLRTGSGPVAVGNALVAAKQAYLASTPQLRGLHEKALLEATLFGFPMLRVNMPGARLTPGSDASIVGATTPFTTDPGDTLGLSFANVTVTPSLATHTVQLTDVSNPSQTSTATYLTGGNGVIANPVEVALPLEVRNVGVSGAVLRGVGFRGGNYADLLGVLPLIGAPTTEVRGVHAPFFSDVLYPIRPWSINYFDALADMGGATKLVVTPAQFQSSSPTAQTGTLRKHTNLSFRLYYSDNFAAFGGGSQPALADAPTIVRVSAVPDSGNVKFSVKVAGNPAAGVQEVWATYTAVSGPFAGTWQSLDLVQSAMDSTRWEGTLPLGGTPAGDVRFMVQAVNGVGLVSLDANLGAYYTPSTASTPTQATALALLSPPTIGAYGTQQSFTARLTNNGSPLSGKVVTFRLGAQSRRATTDINGQATATLSLLGLIGEAEVRASFAGTAQYQSSYVTNPFTLIEQGTLVDVEPSSLTVLAGTDTYMTATVTTAAGRPLGEKTIVFVVGDGVVSYTLPVITDYAGRAPLGIVPLPGGDYTITAYFGGLIPLPGQTVELQDDRYDSSSGTATLTINTPPDCSAAIGNPDHIWSPDKTFWPVTITGVNDPDGDPIMITITSIFQDEPVGTGTNSPDGAGIGTSTAQVRAERDGSGDGRVYHISFTASDGKGGACSGTVRAAIVSHDQSGDIDAIDGGALYDSTVPG